MNKITRPEQIVAGCGPTIELDVFNDAFDDVYNLAFLCEGELSDRAKGFSAGALFMTNFPESEFAGYTPIAFLLNGLRNEQKRARLESSINEEIRELINALREE